MNSKRHIHKLSKILTDINGFWCLKTDYSENEVCIYPPELGYGKHFKLPNKKVIDIDWLLNKCERMGEKSAYTNLKNVFEKIKVQGNIYYTSYGLAFDCLFRSQEKIDQATEPIKAELDKLGIKYTCEYSDAMWVYRFKVSKSKDNIEKINNIK